MQLTEQYISGIFNPRLKEPRRNSGFAANTLLFFKEPEEKSGSFFLKKIDK
jgi:hypothetical protein